MSQFPASTAIERRLMLLSMVMVACALTWNLQMRERKPARKSPVRDQHVQLRP